MFVAEVDAYSQYTTYATCLNVLGYTPAAASSRYYTIGFGTSGVSFGNLVPEWGNTYLLNKWGLNCDNLGDGSVDGVHNFWAGKYVPGNASVTDYSYLDFVMGTTDVSQSTFTLAAAGFVTTGNKRDTWTINESKSIRHPSIGY
jgi:hypothetical protein